MCNINESFSSFSSKLFDDAMQDSKVTNEEILFAMRWVISVMSSDLESGRLTLRCLSMLAEVIERYKFLDSLHDNEES